MTAHADAIREHLSLADPLLGQAIQPLPAPTSRPSEDIYRSLLLAIISQQLSLKAADTIGKRVLALFDDGYPHAEQLLALTADELRAAGLSRQKAAYLQAIASHHLAQPIRHERLSQLPDDAVLRELTQIKGVGRWTVEMLLIFPLDRPDVFSPGDVGLQNAMRAIYEIPAGLKGRELHAHLEELARPWSPHRSIACKYLWAYKATL